MKIPRHVEYTLCILYSYYRSTQQLSEEADCNSIRIYQLFRSGDWSWVIHLFANVQNVDAHFDKISRFQLRHRMMHRPSC